jgi:hypothetical protein
MFVKLTHTHSGEKIYIRADKINVIRQKVGKTLVITDENGQYYNEDAELIKDTVESIMNEQCII